MICETCKRLIFLSETHTCPPAYMVEDEGEAHWERIHGYSLEDALEWWIEQVDAREDHAMLDGGTRTVRIHREGETDILIYTISGEAVPQYYATRTG